MAYRSIGATLALVIGAGLTSAAMADAPHAYVDAQAYTGQFFPPSHASQDFQVTDRPAFAAVVGTTVSSSAYADLGNLKAAARVTQAHSVNSPDDAFGSARSFDFVTITLPGGGFGRFTASISLAGTFGAGAASALYDPARYDNANGDYQLASVVGELLVQTFTPNPAQNTEHDIRVDELLYAHIHNGVGSLDPFVSSHITSYVAGANSGHGTATPFDTYNLEFAFQSGVPFEFRITTTCAVRAIGGAAASCNLQSAKFNGIGNVRDGSGNVVAGYDISASSGLDFAGGYPGGINGGVPEPATWLLMIGGFGAVGMIMRRRRPALA